MKTALADAPQAMAAVIAPLRGTSPAHMGGHSLGNPLSTVSAGGTHHGLVGAHLVEVGGSARALGGRRGKRSEHAAATRISPVHAVAADSATKAAGGSTPMHVMAACMEQANGGFYDGDGRSLDAPISTIASKGANQRLVTAYCVKYYSNGGQWQGLFEPMHTVPTKGRLGLVQTVQVPIAGIDPDVLARARKCAAMLVEQLPEHFPEAADLILLGDYVLVDITLRMLKPRELFRAQGFPEDYVIDEVPNPKVLFEGGVQAADPLAVPRIPLTATAQVRMVGNSVSPLQAEALARWNFSHERLIYGRMAA